MFSAAVQGETIDVGHIERTGKEIAATVARSGLTNWLETVRRYHEGTYQHCLLVSGVVTGFGLKLGVSSPDLRRLYMAAMFHDIGKATIPVAILNKPGALDSQERTVVETHSANGFELLKDNLDVENEVRDAVRHHHEYLDGSGYPDGLSGSRISDLVRILTISDIFAALIEDRRYKPRMPRNQAYDIVSGMDGKLEKPLVEAFRDVALAS
jgi:putative nucleotidyltransferase with HDIG domain